jgi:hypothetical protein
MLIKDTKEMPTKNNDQIYDTAHTTKSLKKVAAVFKKARPKALTIRVQEEVWYTVCHKLLDEPDCPSWQEFLGGVIEGYAAGNLYLREGEIHRARQRAS